MKTGSQWTNENYMFSNAAIARVNIIRHLFRYLLLNQYLPRLVNLPLSQCQSQFPTQNQNLSLNQLVNLAVSRSDSLYRSPVVSLFQALFQNRFRISY